MENNNPIKKPISRREFIRKSALSAIGAATLPSFLGMSGIIAKTTRPALFRPYPHPWMPPMNFIYTADQNVDPFQSGIHVTGDGIVVPEDLGARRFSVNCQWFVEGFGYCSLSADNGGEYYSLNDLGRRREFILNHEFAKSRIARNREVRQRYRSQGTQFSPEVIRLSGLAEEYLEGSTRHISDGEKCASLADKALYYALWSGEHIELEHARELINRNDRQDKVYFGCESRQYVWAKHEDFTKRFVELFNFATITHYLWDTWYELFEPREGVYNWGIKDNIVQWLLDYDITIEGRPLFWFHPIVTPDWLKTKNFSQLRSYVDKHVSNVVGHYGDRILHWEVLNEYHDWANIFNHTPDQITEIVRQACDKTHEVNPKVDRLINNCAPWGEYVARGRMARMDATRPLRTPRQFISDLMDAGVEFDTLGIQVYFGYRDLSDIMRMLERFEKFNKPIYITEIGATSGPTFETVVDRSMGISNRPYDWHRAWDEELQADWLEQVYTLYYSKLNVKAINWYDFSNFRPFIVNGGLVTERCEPKQSFHRLQELLGRWNHLPNNSKTRTE